MIKEKVLMFVKKKIVRVIDFVIKVSVNLKEKNEKYVRVEFLLTEKMGGCIP